MATEVEEQNKDYNLPAVLVPTDDHEDQPHITRTTVRAAAHGRSFPPLHHINIPEVGGENWCLSNGSNFNQQNGEEKVAPSPTGNSDNPEPDALMDSPPLQSGGHVLPPSQSPPVSSGEVVGSNTPLPDVPFPTTISVNVEGETWSMKAIGKEVRCVCFFLGTTSVPWLVIPNGSIDVLNHWYLDFQLYSFCITPFSCLGVFIHSFLLEKNNKVSKRVLTCEIGSLAVFVMLPNLINIIIGIVTKFKLTSTMSEMLLVAFLVVVLVCFISIGAVASKRKVNAGDMESQRTSPNANEGSSIFPLAKGDMKKIFYGIAGPSVAYLTNPSWGSVDLLHHSHLIFQLPCVYVAFCSSFGMLVYLIIDDMKNQPSTTVSICMTVLLGSPAVLFSSIAIITGMIDNVTPTSPIPLVVWTVCFLVIPVILVLTARSLHTEKHSDGRLQTM